MELEKVHSNLLTWKNSAKGLFKTISPKGESGKYMYFKEYEVPIPSNENSRNREQKKFQEWKRTNNEDKKKFPGLKKHELKLFTNL